MADLITTFDAHARAIIEVSRLTPTPSDRERLEATIPQFRAMADLLHDCSEARYVCPSITVSPRR